MMTSVEDARNTCCPFRIANGDETLCIVDDCMGWRWLDSNSGFCGLAGAPLMVSPVSRLEDGEAHADLACGNCGHAYRQDKQRCPKCGAIWPDMGE